MNIKELRKKTVEELNKKLFDLLHDQFNLRIRSVNNRFKNTILLKNIRRNIARIKTLLTDKINFYEK